MLVVRRRPLTFQMVGWEKGADRQCEKRGGFGVLSGVSCADCYEAQQEIVDRVLLPVLEGFKAEESTFEITVLVILN